MERREHLVGIKNQTDAILGTSTLMSSALITVSSTWSQNGTQDPVIQNLMKLLADMTLQFLC